LPFSILCAWAAFARSFTTSPRKASFSKAERRMGAAFYPLPPVKMTQALSPRRAACKASATASALSGQIAMTGGAANLWSLRSAHRNGGAIAPPIPGNDRSSKRCCTWERSRHPQPRSM
jgi:hypothetical protein